MRNLGGKQSVLWGIGKQRIRVGYKGNIDFIRGQKIAFTLWTIL